MRSLGESDRLAFCWSLPKRAGVLAIPPPSSRIPERGALAHAFAFCNRDEVTDEAARRLAAL